MEGKEVHVNLVLPKYAQPNGLISKPGDDSISCWGLNSLFSFLVLEYYGLNVQFPPAVCDTLRPIYHKVILSTCFFEILNNKSLSKNKNILQIKLKSHVSKQVMLVFQGKL